MLALKARMCRTLKWPGFPESGSEVKGMQSIRTHDLDLLLRFSGVGALVKAKHPAEWSVVLRWTPERRYLPVGSSSAQETADMIACVQRIMEVL